MLSHIYFSPRTTHGSLASYWPFSKANKHPQTLTMVIPETDKEKTSTQGDTVLSLVDSEPFTQSMLGDETLVMCADIPGM